MSVIEITRELLDRCQSDLYDITKDQISLFDVVEPKFDGWWALLVNQNGWAVAYSDGGRACLRFQLPPGTPDFVMVGELMYGQVWANFFDPGAIYVHDIARWGTFDTTAQPYGVRRKILSKVLPGLHPKIKLVPMYPVSQWPDLWESLVKRDKLPFEGLVFKSLNDVFGDVMRAGRRKLVVSYDYVCLEITTGGGRNKNWTGTIHGGLYYDGILKQAVGVGNGLTDAQRRDFWDRRAQLVGRVFEAYGRGCFPSGALRHPNFKRWRDPDDKDPRDCVWPPLRPLEEL